MLAILALNSWGQEDCFELEATLGYTVRSCFKKSLLLFFFNYVCAWCVWEWMKACHSVYVVRGQFIGWFSPSIFMPGLPAGSS